jgi:hypothetical protein
MVSRMSSELAAHKRRPSTATLRIISKSGQKTITRSLRPKDPPPPEPDVLEGLDVFSAFDHLEHGVSRRALLEPHIPPSPLGSIEEFAPTPSATNPPTPLSSSRGRKPPLIDVNSVRAKRAALHLLDDDALRRMAAPPPSVAARVDEERDRERMAMRVRTATSYPFIKHVAAINAVHRMSKLAHGALDEGGPPPPDWDDTTAVIGKVLHPPPSLPARQRSHSDALVLYGIGEGGDDDTPPSSPSRHFSVGAFDPPPSEPFADLIRGKAVGGGGRPLAARPPPPAGPRAVPSESEDSDAAVHLKLPTPPRTRGRRRSIARSSGGGGRSSDEADLSSDGIARRRKSIAADEPPPWFGSSDESPFEVFGRGGAGGQAPPPRAARGPARYDPPGARGAARGKVDALEGVGLFFGAPVEDFAEGPLGPPHSPSLTADDLLTAAKGSVHAIDLLPPSPPPPRGRIYHRRASLRASPRDQLLAEGEFGLPLSTAADPSTTTKSRRFASLFRKVVRGGVKRQGEAHFINPAYFVLFYVARNDELHVLVADGAYAATVVVLPWADVEGSAPTTPSPQRIDPLLAHVASHLDVRSFRAMVPPLTPPPSLQLC